MAQRPDARAQLGPILARYQRQLLCLRAELASSPSLTAWDDGPLEFGVVLDPVLAALESAANAIAARPQPGSRRARLGAELSILWADLIEVEPVRLQRNWGHRQVPEAWPEAHRSLLDAVTAAQRKLGH